ncbi:methyltransferase [Streptomyces sp. B6B3]|uniref:methyltransferase n=1 Tax=Streptomyces sp. B6B3 TaxID=3153570 RepID=UPI00325C632C
MRAQERLSVLVYGHLFSRLLVAGLRLGLIERIGDAERPAAELAAECGADPQAMLRLLRALAAVGVLSETEPGRFSVGEVGTLLRGDGPEAFASYVRLFNPPIAQAWDRLEDSVRTGKPVFSEVFGKEFFDWLRDDAELSAVFNGAMSHGTRAAAAVLPAHYDFSRFRTVVDVGGGDGTLLAAILRAHPAVRGVLFDSAEGLAQADATLRRAGVADRCEPRTGDFFAGVPDGGDVYLLKSVLHDWDDERSATILRHCRAAMADGGRVLIVESLLPPVVASPDSSGASPLPYLSDLSMLVGFGGRERTREDFDTLCTTADLTLTAVTPLPPPHPYTLLEAAPA